MPLAKKDAAYVVAKFVLNVSSDSARQVQKYVFADNKR